MLTRRAEQKGMTYLGILLLMVVIAICAIVVIKILPVYLEHFKVTSSLKSFVEDTKGNPAMPPTEIKKLLLRRFDVNDVSHVTKDDIQISKENGKTVISIPYEARVTLFLNLDLVARFPDNRVELGP